MVASVLGDFGQGRVGVPAPARPVLGTQVQLLPNRGQCQLTKGRGRFCLVSQVVLESRIYFAYFARNLGVLYGNAFLPQRSRRKAAKAAK